MHAVKVDSRKIMAAGLVIVAVFAAVAITVNLFYLGQIQSLVRNTTTTSVMELATARAHYLDECLASDQNSVKSLAHFIADVTPQEARDRVEDFISTHEATAAWIRSKDGSTWCSSSETDLYDPALEDELFGPAMAGETGSSEMYLGHAGERRRAQSCNRGSGHDRIAQFRRNGRVFPDRLAMSIRIALNISVANSATERRRNI